MYEKACREAYEILEFLNDEDYLKIDPKLKDYIYENADWDHEFEFDTNKSIEEQDMLEDTKILLTLIYLKEFASDEEKKEILLIGQQNDLNAEKIKNEKYNPNNIFSEEKSYDEILEKTKHVLFENEEYQSSQDEANGQLENSLVEVKEKWYLSLWNKVKDIFNKFKS